MFYPQIIPYLLVACIIPFLCTASQPLITAAPDLLRRQEPGQDSPSCSSFYSIESSCSSIIPNFSNQPIQTQLSCVCYASSTWAGSNYDGYLDTCLAYISSASPSIYKLLGLSTGWVTTPCEEFSPAATSNYAACLEWSSIEASCSLETSNLNALPFSSQASCLCYSGSAYAPSRFDVAWDGCLSIYSSDDPQYYSSITGDQVDRTPCAKEGNVRSGPTAIATATPSSSPSATQPLTTTEPRPTGASGNGAAAWKRRILVRSVAVAIGISAVLL